MEKTKEKLTLARKIEEPDKELSLEELEDHLERLSSKVKKLAKRNGFSKKLKKKAELEIN